MKWVRRIFLGFVLVAVATSAGAYFYLKTPVPDARLACHYGAYDLSDGRIVVFTPSSGTQSFRFVMMDGDTGKLLPVAGQGDIPRNFAAGPGWEGTTPVRTTAAFGACDDHKVALSIEQKPALTGTQRTFDITETTFESHGLKLFGRLVLPRVEGAVPIAVLVHGSESNSAVLFDRLQYLLPANGIGAFVYDKRGTGKSEGTYTQDFNLLADDAAAALKRVRVVAGNLASEVGLEGGSQAGWVEPLAAQKVKADFVLVGFGLAETPVDEDRDCVIVNLRDAGYGDDDIAKAREITDATAVVIASHFTKGFEQLEAVKAKYNNEPWYKVIKGQYTGQLLPYPPFALKIVGPFFDAGTPWAYDSLPPLRAYDGPHLWILAGNDSLAPSAQTLRVLRGLQVDKPNLSVVVFPTADHGIIEFKMKDGARVDTRFAPGYFDLMVDWIKTKRVNLPADRAIVYSGENHTLQKPR